jgi:hypothetical protein
LSPFLGVPDHARGITACCPVKAIKAWLQAAGISEGPLFRPVAKGGGRGARACAKQVRKRLTWCMIRVPGA